MGEFCICGIDVSLGGGKTVGPNVATNLEVGFCFSVSAVLIAKVVVSFASAEIGAGADDEPWQDDKAITIRSKVNAALTMLLIFPWQYCDKTPNDLFSRRALWPVT